MQGKQEKKIITALNVQCVDNNNKRTPVVNSQSETQTTKAGVLSYNAKNFTDLPPEILLDVVAPILTENERIAISLASRSMHYLFKEQYNAHIMSKLLLNVAHGEQAKVKKLLEILPEYLLIRGDLKDDFTHRTFKNITVFEYALWALDSHMWRMMVSCLPKGEKGDAIRQGLLTQCIAVRTTGLSYTLLKDNIEVQVVEQNFNFEPLINALQTYNNQFDSWTWHVRQNHWCTVVGRAQLNLPAHVRNEYCRKDRSLFPTPTFNEKELPRTLEVYNYISKKEEIWTAGLAGLGIDFGVFRVGGQPRGGAGSGGVLISRPLPRYIK